MKYKNISDQDLSIPGVGIVKAGEVADLPEGFHNANFQSVEQPERTRSKKVEPDVENKNNE